MYYYLNLLITISIKHVTVTEAITKEFSYFPKLIEILDFVPIKREWVKNNKYVMLGNWFIIAWIITVNKQFKQERLIPRLLT